MDDDNRTRSFETPAVNRRQMFVATSVAVAGATFLTGCGTVSRVRQAMATSPAATPETDATRSTARPATQRAGEDAIGAWPPKPQQVARQRSPSTARRTR